MIVAVTGASGHVGANLVRELLARGLICRALVHRDDVALEGLDIERVQADVLDESSLRTAFTGADWVVHLAARISVFGDDDGLVHKINVEGTRHVVTACRRAKVKRLVHLSSIHALEQTPLNVPVDETRPLALGPQAFFYDRSKAQSELEVQNGIEQGLDAVIVNPTGIIGPHDYKPSAMGRVLLDLAHRRLPALINGGFNWVDVRDVVAGILAAGEKGRRGERYLLPGHWASISTLAEMAQHETGVRSPRFLTPWHLAKAVAPFAETYARLRGADPLFTRESVEILRSNRRINGDKAMNELAFRPRPLAETIHDTYAWLKETEKIEIK